MAATIVGTVGKHGVLGTLTNLIVTSYSVKKGFELKNLLKNQDGITVGVRYDGKQRTMDIEGTVLASDMPDQGAKITFNIQTDVGSGTGTYSVLGMLEDVTESGRNGDYVSFKGTVAQWDSITSYDPYTPPA